MLAAHRYTPFLYLKALTFLPTPKPYPLFHRYQLPTFSLPFCTNTSDSTSFAVSYLINNFGFSPQFASKLCSTYKVCFKTNQKPDSVVNFFRNHGFSDTQLCHIIIKEPRLLSCKPCKTLLPKFQFCLSKGASTSDIIKIVCKSPHFLYSSLENQIVPTYELVYRFLQSDNDIIACSIQNPALLSHRLVPHNIQFLIDNGVTHSNIAKLLRYWSPTFQTHHMLKLVEELKVLGFNPSKVTFGVALRAKTSVSKTLWKEKVDAFKKWGWSDEDIMKAFKKRPDSMLTSIDKVNLVMGFWVNQLGWDAMAIAKTPLILSLSLEKTIIPRALVVQYLLSKGLRNKSASLTYPFVVTEKRFLDRFIKHFENEASNMLKLYEDKLNLAYTRDKTCMS
ncbi:uncharacterized protein [Medicago truncatula]|nr:uncharacterized protein LOC25488150 [Medicago truncatula]